MRMRQEHLKVMRGIKLKTYVGAIAVSNMGVLQLPAAVPGINSMLSPLEKVPVHPTETRRRLWQLQLVSI
jgi:hypothetical protein